MNEEWKSVVGGAYEASDLGRVRRATPGRATWPGRILAPLRLKNGYLGIHPVVAGKNVQMYVHRLVAEAFIGPCPAGAEVNHIDGDKANPAAANLEYVTHAENAAHAVRLGLSPSGDRHPGSKVTDEQVREIRSASSAGARGCDLSARYGISPATVSEIVHGKKRRAA